MRILLDVDQALLGEARRLLGMASRRDTVERALAELIQDRRRQAAIEAEIVRFESGYYAGRLAEIEP